MDKNNEVFETTKIMANIRNHDFSVADYKMCKSESEVVMSALESYLSDLKFDNLKVINILESAT